MMLDFSFLWSVCVCGHTGFDTLSFIARYSVGHLISVTPRRFNRPHSSSSSLPRLDSERKERDFKAHNLFFGLSFMADALSRFALLRLAPRCYCFPRLLPLIRPSQPSSLLCKAGAYCQLDRSSRFKVHAVVAEESDGPKWWEKNTGPNMVDIHSTQEFLDALSQAGDRLVIVEFYGTWCGSCRALFPKLCRTVEEHPEIMFLKVNFDENKPMCKRLNVRVLPYFHFYRGADGLLESFSCSLAKFQKLREAIDTHNTPRCSIGPPVGVGDLNLLENSRPQEKPAEASSR